MTDRTAPSATPAMPAAGSGTGKGDLQRLIVLVSGVFHAAYTHVLPEFENGFRSFSSTAWIELGRDLLAIRSRAISHSAPVEETCS